MNLNYKEMHESVLLDIILEIIIGIILYQN